MGILPIIFTFSGGKYQKRITLFRPP